MKISTASSLVPLLIGSLLSHHALASGEVRYRRVKPTKGLRERVTQRPRLHLRLPSGRRAILVRGEKSFHLLVEKRTKVDAKAGGSATTRKAWYRVLGLGRDASAQQDATRSVTGVRIGKERIEVAVRYAHSGRAEQAQILLPSIDTAVAMHGSPQSGYRGEAFRFAEVLLPVGRDQGPRPGPGHFRTPGPLGRNPVTPEPFWHTSPSDDHPVVSRVRRFLAEDAHGFEVPKVGDSSKLQLALRGSALPRLRQLGERSGDWRRVPNALLFPSWSPHEQLGRNESRVFVSVSELSPGRKDSVDKAHVTFNAGGKTSR
jgi:hypothetical protein